jgi:hypothetical protein
MVCDLYCDEMMQDAIFNTKTGVHRRYPHIRIMGFWDKEVQKSNNNDCKCDIKALLSYGHEKGCQFFK